jgi:carbohydrate-selective porin OprB
VPGRRLLAAWLLAVALVSAAAAQEWSPQPTPRDDTDQRAVRTPKPEDFLSVNTAVLGTLQWPVKSDVSRGTTFASGSLDVTVTLRPAGWMLIFIDVEGLAGQGPDQRLGTLSRLNKNADDILNEHETVRLMKLVVRTSWFSERFVVSFGKLDIEDYFDRNVLAEDDEAQFLNAALLTSPLLKAPNNGPGVVLRLNADDWRYALGVHANDDVFGDLSGRPYVIGEVGRRNIFAQRGHYRLWARVSALLEDRDRVSWATGVSFDQLITPAFGVFFRAAVSRTEGEPLTSYAWSGGVQVTPGWFGREADTIGIGYSEQREPVGRERVLETYYRLALNAHLSFIANLQWLPTGVNIITGATTRNVVVPGLRALITF